MSYAFKRIVIILVIVFSVMGCIAVVSREEPTISTVTPDLLSNIPKVTDNPYIGSNNCPAFPEGEIIVMASSQITIIDPFSKAVCKFDEHPGGGFYNPLNANPISQNREWLAYSSENVLTLASLSTGDKRNIPMPDHIDSVFWLPDSKHILILTTHLHLYLDIDTGIYAVVQEREPEYVWLIEDVAPDGESYLFLTSSYYSYLGYSDEQEDLFMADFAGGNTQQLTNDNYEEWMAFWVLGGQRIAVIAADPAAPIVLPGCRPSADKVFLLNPATRERSELTLAGRFSAYPRPSPNGTQIVYVNAPGEMCSGSHPICILDLISGQNNCLTVEGIYPTWSPDGRKLVYLTNIPESRYYKLNIFDLESATETTLLSVEDISAPYWVDLATRP